MTEDETQAPGGIDLSAGTPTQDNLQKGPGTGDQDEDLDLARETLRQVCRDAKAPPSARAQAARTLAEMAGGIGKGRDPKKPNETKPLSEMSLDEIDRELAGMGEGAAAAQGS